MKVLSDSEIRLITEPVIDAPKGPVNYRAFLQMCDLCVENKGIGLAAIQVGLPWRMFVVRNPDDTFDCFLNCEYTPEGEEKELSVEGCLSLRTPDGDAYRSFEVSRHKIVRVIGQKLNADLTVIDIDIVLSGLYGVVMQHEIDHSHLIFISDTGKEIHLYK